VRHGITGNLAPGRDVSTAVPASSVLSPPEHEARWPGPGGFLRELATRCEWNTWTGRRSSNPATRTARKHNHGTARFPARSSDVTHPACAGLGEDLLKGLGPLPPSRPSTPGDTVVSSSLQAFRPARSGSARCQPRFRGPGAGRLSPPDSSRRPLESRRRSFAPTRSARTPLVTRPQRHRGENPEPSVARPKPSAASPVTSPRRPFLANKREDFGLRGRRTTCFREAGVQNRPYASCFRGSRASA